jgi:hypothetical protein
VEKGLHKKTYILQKISVIPITGKSKIASNKWKMPNLMKNGEARIERKQYASIPLAFCTYMWFCFLPCFVGFA